MKHPSALLIALGLALAGAADAAVIRVSPTGNNANSGATWAQAKATIPGALAIAAPGDEVWVAAGTYPQAISVSFDVKLYGGFAGTETSLEVRNPSANPTILDGGGSQRILSINANLSRNAVVDGFVFQNGLATHGGAIRWGTASPTISGNVFRNNSALQPGEFDDAAGGAIYGYAGSALVAGNRFEYNVAAFTGTGFSGGAGGGAMYQYEGTPIIVGNTFIGNSTTDTSFFGYAEGGAYYQYTDTVTLISNYFANNTATSDGGAAAVYEGDHVVVNNTFVGNDTADGIGGAFYSYEGTLDFRNNILIFNGSGALFTYSGTGNPDYNCLWNNGFYPYAGFSVGPNDIQADPMLTDIGNFDCRLLPGSPCIDAGNDSALPPDPFFDVFGGVRVAGSAVDIGAHEVSGAMVEGTIDLQDFFGDPTTVSATYEIRQNGNVVESGPLAISANSTYSIQTSVSGLAEVSIKASHWLRRTVSGVTIPGSGSVGVNVSLFNGDVDGDNEVTIGDYAILSSNFGTSGPDGDLNGDGEVDIGDYAILSVNFNMLGDD